MNTLKGEHLAQVMPGHGEQIACAVPTSIHYLWMLSFQPEYKLCDRISREVQKVFDTMAHGDSVPTENNERTEQ